MNLIFVALLASAGAFAVLTGNPQGLSTGLFKGVSDAVEISIGLTGALGLWLGLVRILERAGALASLSRLLAPVIRWLFPDVPADHPAVAAITMNIAANMLGLGNAATPLGIKAMEELARLNPKLGVASDAQALFLAINTANVTLIPATVIALRAKSGAAQPTDILIPGLIASLFATTAAVLTSRLLSRLGRFRQQLTEAAESTVRGPFMTPPQVLSAVSTWVVPLLVVAIPIWGLVRKVPVYEAFTDGAREGFQIAVKIIPYLVAILGAVGALKGVGAVDFVTAHLGPFTEKLGLPAVALPMLLIRPLSGSAANGVVASVLNDPHYGPDSYAGHLVSVMAGSTETTFYVLAVYCGAVGITRFRQALPAALFADLIGFVASIAVCALFFR